MELGPCNIDSKNQSSNGTTWNPYSWNTNANMLFLDQPWVSYYVFYASLLTVFSHRIGVGFSYAEHGETIETTEDAAKNVHAFVSIFFQTFSLTGRPFHMSGESYGGRYLPVFASEIVDQNSAAKAQGRHEAVINLKSVIIGNGNTDGAA
jgi:carboxypeptidase C (cathepsin A)